MWSSAEILTLDQQEAPAKQYEFCSIVNEVIRRDEPGPMLIWAAVFARALNLHCVGSFTGWPGRNK